MKTSTSAIWMISFFLLAMTAEGFWTLDESFAAGPAIAKTNWQLVYTDSEELTGEDGAAVNAFDANATTMWHTEWSGDPDPAHPHEIVIDLGATYDLDGFSYEPFQVNGRIIDYEFYVGTSNGPWTTPVASGTLADDASIKTVSFGTTTGRYIRLVALSEPNGNPWTSAAEIGVNGTLHSSSSIAKTNWQLVYVDSEELSGEDGAAVNAFDADAATMWHTQWSGDPDPAHPHEIVIDLGATYDLDGFSYEPFQVNGRIIDYEFYVGTSNGPWTTPVASGALADDATVKTVSFATTTGRYIRLVALSEPNGNPWTSAAEIGVTGAPGGSSNTAPQVDAGANQTITLPNALTLTGTVSDDGLPDPPAAVTSTWSQVGGPGTANFTDAGSLATSVTFDQTGTYTLRLTADDGQYSAFDEMTVVADESNEILTTEVRVQTAADDAEESAAGTVSLTSSDLELVRDRRRNHRQSDRGAALQRPGRTPRCSHHQRLCSISSG